LDVVTANDKRGMKASLCGRGDQWRHDGAGIAGRRGHTHRLAFQPRIGIQKARHECAVFNRCCRAHGLKLNQQSLGVICGKRAPFDRLPLRSNLRRVTQLLNVRQLGQAHRDPRLRNADGDAVVGKQAHESTHRSKAAEINDGASPVKNDALNASDTVFTFN
jgi:hypothetical protein